MKRILLILWIALSGCAAAPDDRYSRRTDDLFAQVKVGMTQDETLALLGRPDQAMPFPRTGNLAWSYIYWDQYGYLIEHSITFGPDGRVLLRTIRRMNDGNNGHR